MKYAIPLLVLAMTASAEMSVCGTEELLPIGFTEEELLLRDQIGLGAVPTSPPPEGTMNPGEFDPATGVFIRWPLGVPYSLIVAFSERTTVWVICEEYQQSDVNSAFTSAGVNMSNVDYVFAPTNSIWVRDYGPWFVVLQDGTQGIFNYEYNRPRPYDNLIPGVVGDAWGIPVYSSTIVHTGGNYMSSGFDQAMSTDLVYSENGGNEDWVDSQMALYLGIDNYVTMPDPQSGSINHIDCWAKMLSPGKIMVLRVPPSHGDYVALEASADMLANTESPYGRNWEVYRVDGGGSQGYTNSLINENYVYLPLYNSSYDTMALIAYEEAMPGYIVEGYTHSGWQTFDALHCRTRNVMDPGMLFIRHVPVEEEQPAEVPVTVDALIRCNPENTLTSQDVMYRTGSSGPFTSVTMSPAGSDSFTADIPGVSAGQTVQYYIAASDDSGRDEAVPRFAPDTWFFEYSTSGTGTGGGTSVASGVFVGNPGPNPFSGIVSIPYAVSSPVTVAMTVHDISGRTVYRSETVLDAGSGALSWGPEATVPAGLYLVRLEGPGWHTSHRVTLIR